MRQYRGRRSTSLRIGLAALPDGERCYAALLRRAQAAPANRFTSSGELLAYSEALLDRSTRMSAAYFLNVPAQAVEIAPMPGYQRNSGIESHFAPDDHH